MSSSGARIRLRLKVSPEDKALLRAAATARGLSINALMLESVKFAALGALRKLASNGERR